MSDPIADIIIEQPWKSECTEKRDGKWYCVMNQQQLSDYAKQIRQQLGRELLEDFDDLILLIDTPQANTIAKERATRRIRELCLLKDK